MDELEGIVLSETGQTEKYNYCLISLNVWNVKNKTKIRTHRKRSSCQRQGVEGLGKMGKGSQKLQL